MADDPNKSDKPVNGKVPKHLSDVFGQRDYNVDYAHLVTKQSAATIKERLDAVEDIKALATTPAMRQTIDENLTYVQGELDTEIDRLESIHTPKYNENLASSIETYTKHRNVNSRTTTLSGKARFGRAAQTHRDRYLPTEQLEERNRILMEEQGQIGELMAGQARDLGAGDEAKSVLGVNAKRVGAIDEEIAFNKRLMKTQSRQGLSTEKLTNRGQDLDEAISDFLAKKGIERKVDSGDVKSYDEESKKMGYMRSNRNKLQEKYNDAIDEGSDMAGIFAEKLKKANDALDTQTKIVKRMSDKGMDQNDLVGKFGAKDVVAGLAFAGASVANVARNTNSIMGNQDITQMNNRAAFAAEGNRLYGKAESALLNNDVDAAMELATMPGFAKKYADRNRKIAHTTGWTAAAGNAIGNIGGGALKGVGIGTAAGAGLAVIAAPFTAGASLAAAPALMAMGAKIGGTIGGLSGASDTAAEMSNLAYGNVGADASLRSIQAIQNLDAQSRKIKTHEMQKYYSQHLNAYKGGMGLGNAQASGMSTALTDEATLAELAATGIDLDQSVQLGSMLKMAGNFGGAGAGINMIKSAGVAGQKGIMGREEYMTAATRMVAMGGSNEELQKIISAGMDNSKNIMQMVDASTQMSAGLASLGVAGTGTTSKMLSAAVQEYKGMGINENLATGTAAAAMANLSKGMRSKGMTFGNVIERAKLRGTRGLEDADVFQMNALSELSLEEMAILREGEKEGQRLASRKGIKDLIYNKDGSNKAGVMDSVANAALKGVLVDVGGVETSNEMIRKARAGEEFTQRENAVANQAGTDQVAMRRAYSSVADPIDKNDKKINGEDAERLKGEKKVSQFSGGKKFGEEYFGKDAFKGIEGLMTAIGEMDGQEFHDKVVESANKFEQPVIKFGEHVTEMGRILKVHKETLGKMGEDRAPGEPIVNPKIPGEDKPINK